MARLSEMRSLARRARMILFLAGVISVQARRSQLIRYLHNPQRERQERSMSKFTFEIVNNRKKDASQLHLLLTASNQDTGLEGIELNKSTPLEEFFSRNPGHSFTAEKLVSARFYVGYDPLPENPDPNSKQYYGWVEFSRDPAVDTGVWINLSNVDIVGLPLTIKCRRAGDDSPFSLGYKKSVNEIIGEMKSRALTSQNPAVVKDCGPGRTKIVAPNVQFPYYRRYDDYLDSLTQAGARLTIQTDTPKGGAAKTFTGSFARGAYASLSDTSPILTLKCGSDTFQILKSQFTTEYLYRCDGGTIIYNGATLPQNQNDHKGTLASAVYTNSLFRNLCIGINEGYFNADGDNDSAKFSSDRPFGDGRGNVFAQIMHESSNSYGFPYADSNLKTLIVAGIASVITVTILKDEEPGDYHG
jgi:hypothetical protein